MNPALPRIYLVRHGDTASVSVLGYDHDLFEPVIHAWNGRGT
jgi:hypothetical protein